MGLPVLVLGKSGSGKSASIRTFEPNEVGIINVTGKRLPFKGNYKTINTSNYQEVVRALTMGKCKSFVIDDSQYLMAFEFFDRVHEKGFDKFTNIAVNFRNLIEVANRKIPEDVIVYFLHHTEETEHEIKAKTIGKMLDEKLTLEGLFTIVLRTKAEQGEYRFVTQTNGFDTTKSPLDMFPAEIDNDLKYVDQTIRNYYEFDKEIKNESNPSI